ncbi:hypothetical protein YPPY72_1306, partial [Yersinia pestis PY-72]
MEHDCLLH